MQQQITTIYCLCDDFLKACGQADDPQAKMTTAQVMTVALVAAALLGGNHDLSRLFLKQHGYLPQMLSKSRLNRRLHAIPEALWQGLFHLLAQVHTQMSHTQMNQNQPDQDTPYVIDSMPVPVCDNIRIRRSRLYPRKTHGERFRGYIASKRRYVYGLRVHLLVTAAGLPVEVALAPASEADIAAFRSMTLNLPAGATVFADAAYLDCGFAGVAGEAGLDIIAQRRGNSRDPLPAWVTYLCQRTRRCVETVFSGLRAALGGHVHAVTPRGFELKVFLTVLAHSILA